MVDADDTPNAGVGSRLEDVFSSVSTSSASATTSIVTRDRQCAIENRSIYRQFDSITSLPSFFPRGCASYHYCDVSVWNADNAGDIQEVGLDRNTVLYVVRPGRQLSDVVAGEDETVRATCYGKGTATHKRTHAPTPIHTRTHVDQMPHHTPATVTHSRTVASSLYRNHIGQLTT